LLGLGRASHAKGDSLADRGGASFAMGSDALFLAFEFIRVGGASGFHGRTNAAFAAQCLGLQASVKADEAADASTDGENSGYMFTPGARSIDALLVLGRRQHMGHAAHPTKKARQKLVAPVSST